jgi:tetratricopeptide (TPR) repeat protein
MAKPKLFIGSSVEGLNIAYALQENLKFVSEVTVWTQGVFNLSETSLESLINVLEESDFGVFVFTPDDYIKIRGKKDLAVRDNVLFELGLFVGRLGRSRAFIIIPDNKEFHLPTDLIGMTPGKYEANRLDNNMQAGTGSVSHKIREQIQKQGVLNISSDEPESSNPVASIKKIDNDDWIGALYIEKDYEKAGAILKSKIKSSKDIDEKLQFISQQCYIEFKKDPIKGAREYEQVILEYPDNNISYISYASHLYYNKSYKKSLEIIEVGLAKTKRIITLTNLKADCFWITNRKTEAIELLSVTLITNQDPLMILKLLDFYIELENKKEALILLQKAYLTFPDNEQIKYRFARLAYENGQKEISILLYKELLADFNENSTYWCLLGNSYLDFELYNFALSAYEKAADLSQHKEGWIFDNIGNLYNNKQLYNKAEENLKKAINLNDKSDYTHSRLSSVYSSKQTDDKKVAEILTKAKVQIGTDLDLPF